MKEQKVSKSNQLKIGVVISYATTAIGILINLIYTPLLTSLLGQTEYGLYTVVASVVNYLSLFSLGFGSAYLKYYSNYKVKNKQAEICRLNGMFLVVFSFLAVCAFITGMFLVKYDKVLYTGMIDEYFDYCLGELEYRSLRFEEEFIKGEENYQGNAVVNYTERQIPYTRIIEHKHFEFGKQPDTVITREYPADWKKGDEPYYPVNNDKNDSLFAEYKKLAEKEQNVLFGGRLGQYKYYDMDKVIEAAMQMCEEEIK